MGFVILVSFRQRRLQIPGREAGRQGLPREQAGVEDDMDRWQRPKDSAMVWSFL